MGVSMRRLLSLPTTLLCLLLLLQPLSVSAAREWAVVTLTNSIISRALPANFVGWSFEHIHANQMMRRRQFQQLMRNLQAVNGGEGPTIRLGGNSAEYCAYTAHPERGIKAQGFPPGVKFMITDDDIKAVAAGVPTWRGKVIVGLNFLSDTDSTIAVNHLKALMRLLPKGLLAAVEVGNEVDLFNRHYRKLSWYYFEYELEFRKYAADLLAAAKAAKFHSLRFRGPSLAMPKWYRFTSRYAGRFGPQGSRWLRYASGHWYGLSACGGATVTPALLASKSVIDAPLAKIEEFAEAAWEGGLPAHLGETNSVACSGKRGVSDTFIAALWALEWLSGLARIGIAQANFHGGPTYAYTAFAVRPSEMNAAERKRLMRKIGLQKWSAAKAKGKSVTKPPPEANVVDPLIMPRPLYYAALMFTMATKDSGRMLRVVTHTNCEQTNAMPEDRAEVSPYIVAHAFRSQSDTYRVLVINKGIMDVIGPVDDAYVRIVLPEDGLHSGNGGVLTVQNDTARVIFLLPPTRGETSAIDGVTLGGQTFDASPSGLPRGTRKSTDIPLEEGRYFSLALPPGSAALLTWYTSPRGAKPAERQQQHSAQRRRLHGARGGDAVEEGLTVAPDGGLAVDADAPPGSGDSAQRRRSLGEVAVGEGEEEGAWLGGEAAWDAAFGPLQAGAGERREEEEGSDAEHEEWLARATFVGGEEEGEKGL